MKQVVTYPNGFVAYSVGWPIVHTTADFDDKLAAVRFSKVAAPKDKSVISNPIIERLFEEWRAFGRKSTDATFIEDVMSAALQAFGTSNMYEWCHMQTLSPYFTANHRQFLNETFDFIETGKRRFSHPTWMQQLRLELASPEDAKVYFAYQEFFRVRDAALLKPPTDAFSFITRWLSKPGGVDDLLQSLHVLFGETV